MAFILPRHPLKPARRLSHGLDPTTVVVPAQEMAAWRTAEQIVQDAELQASMILAEAEETLQSERERGYREGREEALREKSKDAIDNVARTVEYYSKVESRMAGLVMQAVRKIISDYDDQPQIFITVRNALSVLRNQKQLVLRLNPTDVETMRKRVNDLLAAYPGIGYVDVTADVRVSPGACLIESEIGLVEASMESQFEALQSALERFLGRPTQINRDVDEHT
jgi:type III secretion protein L